MLEKNPPASFLYTLKRGGGAALLLLPSCIKYWEKWPENQIINCIWPSHLKSSQETLSQKRLYLHESFLT
jgi:hypothetical protein